MATQLARLALANSEHLCAACGANASDRWPAVLQRDLFGILYLPFRPTFETICLRHSVSPPFKPVEYNRI